MRPHAPVAVYNCRDCSCPHARSLLSQIIGAIYDIHMIYMAILYSSGKRRRFWSCYATTLGFWDGATRTLDPGFQAARDGDLDQLHLGCIQATLPNFGVWEWGDVFGSYCNTFPVVVWMFLVVSSQFLCEFPAVFVDFAVQTTHQVPLGPERLGRVPSRGPARQHGGPLGRGRRTCGDARWLDVHHIIGLEDV